MTMVAATSPDQALILLIQSSVAGAAQIPDGESPKLLACRWIVRIFVEEGRCRDANSIQTLVRVLFAELGQQIIEHLSDRPDEVGKLWELLRPVPAVIFTRCRETGPALSSEAVQMIIAQLKGFKESLELIKQIAAVQQRIAQVRLQQTR